MERRDWMQAMLTGSAGLVAASAGAQTGVHMPATHARQDTEVYVERDEPGLPHKGKVLAAIQPHNDDMPIYYAGAAAKMINEGYTAYLIRTTNDEKPGPGTLADTNKANEIDNFEVGRVMGFKKVYDLGYRNHRMDNVSIVEVRARLIFLFRLLKVNTIITYDSWGHYDRNPDHWMTARAVETALWMAGGRKDYPEHFDAGLEPSRIRETYYYARGPQLVNRIVDISSVIDVKAKSLQVCQTQGPGGSRGSRLKKELAGKGLQLPLLRGDDEAADIAYIKEFALEHNRTLGRKYGLEWAEKYHYWGPSVLAGQGTGRVNQYVEENAVPL